MADNPINRNVLALLDEVENEIQTFRGLRHLWANQVANHTTTIHGGMVDPDIMMQEQKTRLWWMVGQAVKLFDTLYPDRELPNRKFRRVIPEPTPDEL